MSVGTVVAVAVGSTVIELVRVAVIVGDGVLVIVAVTIGAIAVNEDSAAGMTDMEVESVVDPSVTIGEVASAGEPAAETGVVIISTVADEFSEFSIAVSVASGTTTRGVAVTVITGLARFGRKMRPASGEAEAGLTACRVAFRSAVTWVSTLEETVTTGSLGCELERVSTNARKRLASNVPTAIRALTRFKLTSRSGVAKTDSTG